MNQSFLKWAPIIIILICILLLARLFLRKSKYANMAELEISEDGHEVIFTNM